MIQLPALWLPTTPKLIDRFGREVRGHGWWGTCPQDCCDEILNSCCTVSDDEIIVDLGAGGLIDAACDYCDQVAGQYTATYVSTSPDGKTTTWRYYEADVCSTEYVEWALRIGVALICDDDVFPEPAPGIYWGVEVFLQTPTADYQGRWTGSYALDSDCFSGFAGSPSRFAVDLNSQSNNVACTGSLPDPIHLERV